MSLRKGLPPILVTTRRIWDAAPHNAFTDLLYHHGKFYIAFRESDSHQGSLNGVIRILESRDGVLWESISLIEMEGVDLRDPKLSVLPDGQIHLLMGGSILDAAGNLLSTSTRVALAKEDFIFSSPTQVLEKDEWLWRLTWHKGVGYGVAYQRASGEPHSDTFVTLYETRDGHHFSKLALFDLDEKPSEATIRFDGEDKMVILIRRHRTWKTHALMGESYAPFTDWIWYDLGYSIGGPNFLILPQGDIWISGRLIYGTPYGLIAKTALLKKEPDGFRRELLLPSFGDTSYPGLLYHNGFLWISYYSTHEEKTAIYLSKILLPN